MPDCCSSLERRGLTHYLFGMMKAATSRARFSTFHRSLLLVTAAASLLAAGDAVGANVFVDPAIQVILATE